MDIAQKRRKGNKKTPFGLFTKRGCYLYFFNSNTASGGCALANNNIADTETCCGGGQSAATAKFYMELR